MDRINRTVLFYFFYFLYFFFYKNPAQMNLEAIASYCNPSVGKIKEIKALDGLNHMFQPSATGSPNEYGSNEITFDNTAIQEILNFLDRITQ